MRLKKIPLFCQLSFRCQRKHLISSAIRQHRSVPAAKLMKTSRFPNNLNSRPQIQMVRIPQNNLCLYVFHQISVEQTSYGCQRAYRHKNRSIYLPMIRNQLPGTGPASRIFMQHRKIHPTNINLLIFFLPADSFLYPTFIAYEYDALIRSLHQLSSKLLSGNFALFVYSLKAISRLSLLTTLRLNLVTCM